MTEFIQHLINGLGLGSIYALIALGYTMVFGVLQFINFAHGDVYMLGAYTAFYLNRWFKFSDSPGIMSLCLALVGSVLTCGAIGFAIERLAYKPLRQSPKINLLITAIGVSLLIENLAQLVFSPDPQAFPTLIQSGVLSFGALQISVIQLTVLLISMCVMVGLQTLVHKTKTGAAMRAVAFNHQHAALMGIPVDRIISLTFVIGSMLAGVAGVLVGLAYPRIDPLMGVMFGLKAFAAAVIGGIGNMNGAVLGALLMGVSESLVVAYGSSTYRDAFAFLLLIVILLFKPTGLFGGTQTEKV